MKKVRLCLISGSQARAPLVSQERQITRANIYYKSEITEVIEYLLQMRETSVMCGKMNKTNQNFGQLEFNTMYNIVNMKRL